MSLESARLDEAGQQAESAVTPQPPDSAALILSLSQRALMRAVLNRLIPPRDTLAGAGDLGIASTIERSMLVSTALRRRLLDGLTEIELVAFRRHRAPFADVDPARQSAILEEVEHQQPGFFAELVEHAYRGYYLLPEVLRAIGAPSRPPQPLGYRLEPFDPSLLEQQRSRAPFWRQAP